MSHRPAPRPRPAGWSAGLGLLLTVSTLAAAQAPPRDGAGAVARCASPAGTLLRRAHRGKEWSAVPAQGDVAASDHLVALPGDRAAIEAHGGGVRITLWGNLPGPAAGPTMEAALVLHSAKGLDLDVTLERGRIFVSNTRDAGPASARVRFEDHEWDIVLEGGAEVSVERFAAWPRGTVFTVRLRPGEVPFSVVSLWVLKGSVALRTRHRSEQYSLHAPPGPAYFHWDSAGGLDPVPRRRDRLPPWADPAAPPKPGERELRATAERRRPLLSQAPVAKVIADEMEAADPPDRALAVYAAGALGELTPLVDALGNPRHPDVRAAAIPVLQHWLGESPRHLPELYRHLRERRGYTSNQAEIAVQLLLGFSDEALSLPETYETLIAYLRNPRLPIRELARWTLTQVVPAGRRIAFDPAGPPPEQERAFREWKQLIPDGKLPPPAPPGR